AERPTAPYPVLAQPAPPVRQTINLRGAAGQWATVLRRLCDLLDSLLRRAAVDPGTVGGRVDREFQAARCEGRDGRPGDHGLRHPVWPGRDVVSRSGHCVPGHDHAARQTGSALITFIATFSPSLQTDKDMWLFNQPQRKQLKEKYGFDVTETWLDHVQKSSVRFNSGSSGSFVSEDGLVISNHHVGADALQK